MTGWMEDNSCAIARALHSAPCCRSAVAAAFSAHIHKNNLIATLIRPERWDEWLCVPSHVMFAWLGAHLVCVVRPRRPLEEV
jgi:hypothetical protein